MYEFGCIKLAEDRHRPSAPGNTVKQLIASVNEGNFLTGCGSFVLSSTELFGVRY